LGEDTRKKKTEDQLDAIKEDGLLVYAEKTKYSYKFSSHYQTGGWNNNIGTTNKSFENATKFTYFGTRTTN
jgi:hypothetical protein